MLKLRHIQRIVEDWKNNLGRLQKSVITRINGTEVDLFSLILFFISLLQAFNDIKIRGEVVSNRDWGTHQVNFAPKTM